MKHYLMAFIIVFSALSSQWVGAMSFQDSNSHNHQIVKDMGVESTAIQSEDHKMAGHGGCPSMKEVAKAIEKVVSASCPSCEEDCQCDSNVCHSSSFSLATLSANRFNLQVLTESSVTSVQSNLPMAPVSLEIRPPKSA